MKQILLVGVNRCMGSNERPKLERQPPNRTSREGLRHLPNNPLGADVQRKKEHGGHQ
jgi:hypothetical protein